MHFSLQSLSLLALFAAAASATSGFARTCENIHGFANVIRAECRMDEHGPIRPSMIDLNRCLKNHRGELRCGHNGNYQASCINCSLRGHSGYECLCRNVERGHPFVPTHIDLNKCIGNRHGELNC